MFGLLICFSTYCFSVELKDLMVTDEVSDCNNFIKSKKNSLDDFIICMSAINHLDVKNNNDVKNVATIVRNCHSKIDEYDFKSKYSCSSSQAKQISKLDAIVIDFMKCATESRFEDDYLANYLFCHADMMSKYNKDFVLSQSAENTTLEDLL